MLEAMYHAAIGWVLAAVGEVDDAAAECRSGLDLAVDLGTGWRLGSYGALVSLAVRGDDLAGAPAQAAGARALAAAGPRRRPADSPQVRRPVLSSGASRHATDVLIDVCGVLAMRCTGRALVARTWPGSWWPPGMEMADELASVGSPPTGSARRVGGADPPGFAQQRPRRPRRGGRRGPYSRPLWPRRRDAGRALAIVGTSPPPTPCSRDGHLRAAPGRRSVARRGGVALAGIRRGQRAAARDGLDSLITDGVPPTPWPPDCPIRDRRADVPVAPHRADHVPRAGKTVHRDRAGGRQGPPADSPHGGRCASPTLHSGRRRDANDTLSRRCPLQSCYPHHGWLGRGAPGGRQGAAPRQLQRQRNTTAGRSAPAQARGRRSGPRKRMRASRRGLATSGGR